MHFAIDLQTEPEFRMLSRMSMQHAETASGAERVARASNVERAASWLSLACAVHCLVMPLALSALPLLSASPYQLDTNIDHALNVLVIVSAVAGSVWGYRRHGELRFVVASALGLAAYLAGHALEPRWYGVFAAVVGALVLAASAYFGARLGHERVHPHHAGASHSH
jgi:uncharacterized membrane protein